MKQMVNLTLRNIDFNKTYKFNIYKQSGYNLRFEINDSVFGKGYVDLLIKFEKHSDGQIYCMVYQVYAIENMHLIYNKPITSLLYPWEKGLELHVQGDNIDFYGTFCKADDDSRREGYPLNWMKDQFYSIDVSFANAKKQEEMDNLYKNLSRQEE